MNGANQSDERYFERLLVRGIEKLGGVCWKFISPGHSGVPDRIIVLPPNGSVIFVEMKAPGKRERPLQKIMQNKLRELGVTVFSSVDSKDKVEDVIVECVRRVYITRPEKGGGDV